MSDAIDRIRNLLSVPRLAVLSSAVSRRRPATFTFGQSSKSCQVRAGSRQVGTTALVLLAAALGATPAHSVWSYQHAVTRVTVEVVLATHWTIILTWRKTEKGLFEILSGDRTALPLHYPLVTQFWGVKILDLTPTRIGAPYPEGWMCKTKGLNGRLGLYWA